MCYIGVEQKDNNEISPLQGWTKHEELLTVLKVNKDANTHKIDGLKMSVKFADKASKVIIYKKKLAKGEIQIPMKESADGWNILIFYSEDPNAKLEVSCGGEL